MWAKNRVWNQNETHSVEWGGGGWLHCWLAIILLYCSPNDTKSTIKSCYSDLKLGNSHKYNCKSSLFFSQSLSITFQTESNLQGFTGLFSDYLYRRSQFVRLYSAISREKLMVVYELIISVNQIGEKLSDDICSKQWWLETARVWVFFWLQN